MYTTDQIRAAGIAGEISSIDVGHLINILEECNNKDASQFKQPDISEDVRKAAEKYLTDLGIANTGMFTSRTMLKTFEDGAEWQRQQHIPTVDEDKDEDEFWNKVGAILNGSVSFSMYPKYLATLKQRFSITRK